MAEVITLIIALPLLAIDILILIGASWKRDEKDDGRNDRRGRK